jgi:hypothetical protein
MRWDRRWDAKEGGQRVRNRVNQGDGGYPIIPYTRRSLRKSMGLFLGPGRAEKQ